MSTLEFMNQDGEWERFPSDSELYLLQQIAQNNPDTDPPIHPQVTTVCHLCNEPFPIEQIKVTGGNLGAGFTWSCPKCHAVTSTGKA